MVTKTTHIVEFETELEKARGEVSRFADTTQKQLDKINFRTTVSAIQAGFAIAEKAAQAVGRVFQFTAGEAIEAEEANLRLARAMRAVGDFSQDAVESFDQFAKQLQSISGRSDESIKSAAALAKNFNLVNDEAKAATKAGLALSIAFGDDLNSSVERVARTFSGAPGSVDKSLARILPELKTLTKEQLIAGEAARIIAERFPIAFGGTTQANIDRLKNSVSELGETFGKFLLPPINSAVTALDKLVNNVDEFVSRDFNLARQFEGSGGIDAFARQGQAAFVAKQRREKFGDGSDPAAIAAQAEAAKAAKIKADRELDAARIKSEAEFQSIKLELEKFGLDEVGKIQAEFNDKRKAIEEAARTGVIKSEEERIRLIGKLEAEEAKKVFDERKRLRDKERAEVAAAAADGFETLINKENLTNNERNAAGLGIAANATKGEAGARNVVSSAAGAVANAFLPGIGGIVKEIIDTLASGPEKVKQTVTEFIQAIPRIITNILSSIPTLIITLLKEIPKSIVKFIAEGVPEIIDAFIKGIPEILKAFMEGIGDLVTGLVKAVVKAVPEIIKSFAEALVAAASDFVDAIIDAAKDIGGAIGIGDGGSGGGGLGDILDPFSFFATGGRVPDLPKYRGDRYPAQLDAGEQVLSRDLSSKLEQFLQGGQAGGAQTVVLQIGTRELARVLLDTNQRGFRTA